MAIYANESGALKDLTTYTGNFVGVEILYSRGFSSQTDTTGFTYDARAGYRSNSSTTGFFIDLQAPVTFQNYKAIGLCVDGVMGDGMARVVVDPFPAIMERSIYGENNTIKGVIHSGGGYVILKIDSSDSTDFHIRIASDGSTNSTKLTDKIAYVLVLGFR